MDEKEIISVLINQRMRASFGPLELIIFNTVLMTNNSLQFKHKHDWFELHLVLKSDAVINIGGDEVEVKEGQLCWINPGAERYVKNDPLKEMRHFVIHFDLVEAAGDNMDVSRLSDLRLFLSSIYKKKSWVCNDENRCAAVYGLICNELTFKRFGYMLKVQNFLSSFIIAAIQSIGIQGMLHVEPHLNNYSNLAYNVVTYIRNNYNKGITLSDTAKALNVSPRHVTRILRDTYDTTYNRVLVAYQIETAKMLICNSQLTLEKIAEKVGFSSPGILRDNFQRYTGISIKEYRNRFSAKEDK